MGLRPTIGFVSLPGVKKPLGQYGPAGVGDSTAAVAQKAAATAAADDDDDDVDDVDLFGSDDEVRTQKQYSGRTGPKW